MCDDTRRHSPIHISSKPHRRVQGMECMQAMFTDDDVNMTDREINKKIDMIIFESDDILEAIRSLILR